MTSETFEKTDITEDFQFKQFIEKIKFFREMLLRTHDNCLIETKIKGIQSNPLYATELELKEIAELNTIKTKTGIITNS